MGNPALPYIPPIAPQTRVDYFPNPGLNGTLADSGHHDISTALVESPGFEIGLAIVLGAGGYGFGRLPAQSTDISNGLVIGFSLYKPMQEPAIPHYLPTFAADILRKGRIWVVCQGAMVDQGPVFIIYSGANAGQVRGDAGSGGNAATAFTRAVARQGAAAGGLVILDVSTP